MRFATPLIEARLLRRYQRFLADVEFADGGRATAHCPNTGSMLGCQEPGSTVWLSPAARPGRRCAWTWEIVRVGGGVLVGIHTGRTNALVREAIEAGRIDELRGYRHVQPEVALPGGRSRADFLLRGPRRRPLWLEVKNVTAAVSGRVALFPDAPSQRAARHVAELARRRRAGDRAMLVFCAQRRDVHTVRPAAEIDPAYARALGEAAGQGLEIAAYRARVTPREIVLREPIGWEL